MSLISDAGLPNGVAIVFANDITRIRWEGNACACIQELMQVKGCVLLKPVLDLTSLEAVLQSVQRCFG